MNNAYEFEIRIRPQESESQNAGIAEERFSPLEGCDFEIAVSAGEALVLYST
jgi:hypothetical protein